MLSANRVLWHSTSTGRVYKKGKKLMFCFLNSQHTLQKNRSVPAQGSSDDWGLPEAESPSGRTGEGQILLVGFWAALSLVSNTIGPSHLNPALLHLSLYNLRVLLHEWYQLQKNWGNAAQEWLQKGTTCLLNCIPQHPNMDPDRIQVTPWLWGPHCQGKR